MLDEVIQNVKTHLAPLFVYIKQIQDMFSTSKDVYGDLLGVDLDDSSILAVQLSNPLGVARLSRVGAIGLPIGAISEDVIIDNAVVITSLKKMLSTARIRAKNMAMAMPGSKVAIKEIKIDGPLSDAEAENKAWQEARRTFPELAKNLFLDFVQVQRQEKEYVLIVVFCRREDVLPRVEMVSHAGLMPKIMEVDYYALERAYPLFESQLPPNHVDQYLAVIDFNPHSLLFLVMHKKTVIFRSRQAYTGDVLVPIVQRAMDLEVSTVKVKPVTLTPIGVSLQTPLQMNIEQHTSLLNEDQKTHVVMTIRRLFQSFYAENSGKVIAHIALSGRCALIPEVVHHLEKSLEIPVKTVNPLLALKIGEHVDANRAMKIGPALTISCGLALRGIPLWK
jgi:type IV pilus assembly protein PilM